MASTGKKGKKNKGKTVPLNDFLSNTISWSDQVDEADKLGEFTRKPALPAAPRSARALEIDESKIPKNPPYVAYVSNLSYELQDGDISDAFVGLNVTNVRLPRDERSGRLKGFGYVEFGDRDSFISGLMKYEATIRGRRIKIDVAENEGERRRGGPRDFRDRDSNYDSEKTLGDWRSGPKRSEFSNNDDRKGPMSGRKDYGGFRDRERDRDNYDNGRSGESNWRDSDRRYGGDRDNRNYGNRRNYDDSDPPSEPKTRTKLNLQPRTRPIEEIVVKEDPSLKRNEEREEPEKPSASIFGQAKPVDTAAREREIEQRLEKEKEGVKGEKEFDKSKPKSSEEDGNDEGKRPAPPESKENIWVRRSQRVDAQDATSRDSSDGKTDDLDEADKESEKKNSENAEESTRHVMSTTQESDRDNDTRYGRYSKNETRYNDRNRDGDKFGRDDRWRDDKDQRDRDRDRDRDRRDFDRDRRDRGYDSDRRTGNSIGRPRDRDDDSRRYDRDGDSRRYNDREGDYRRYNDRESDWRDSNERDGELRRGQDRDSGRYRDQDDYGGNRGGPRGDKRGGLGSADKGSRPIRSTQDRERGQQSKDRLREQKKADDGLRLPKYKEAAAPNYIATNKYSCLDDDDGTSE